ncbi:MAG: response regulator, partial [Deltaproteobacteria bacterium]|nr:response regulator [Deltaproteobacteria bacterium]
SFSQLDPSAARSFGGTGLGLAISKRLVEQMGGRIWLEPGAPPGSTFRFELELPVARGEAEEGREPDVDLGGMRVLVLDDNETAEPSAVPEGEAQAPRPVCALTSARVLLVEDNPVNRTYAEALLRKMNARVSSAASAEAALALLSRQEFDLVLMDVQMPHMDGLEATRTLRTRGLTVPVIGVTAHALKGDREKCLAAGMDDYLSKPVKPELLYAKIAEWTKPRKRSPVDLDELLQTLGGDREAVRSVVAKMRKEARRQLDEMRAGLETDDAARLGKAAHRLRGSFLLFKAEEAVRLVEELEATAREGDLSRVPAAVGRLASVVEEVLSCAAEAMATE